MIAIVEILIAALIVGVVGVPIVNTFDKWKKGMCNDKWKKETDDDK
jgi:hypothetical protein